MPMTVLEICQEALETIGVDPPSSIVSSTDAAKQLKGLINSVGRDLNIRGGDFGWQALRTEASFTTLATELQVNLATDFPYIRRIINDTFWNHTQQRRIYGPVSVQTWRRYKADTVAPATLVVYIRGNQILFPGTPTAGETVFFEYVDKRTFVATNGTTLKERVTVDTDELRIDDHMAVLGVRWRYLQAKGLEYGEWFRQYEDYVQERLGSDVPHEKMSVNPNWRRDGWEDQQIPEGSWNI